MNTSCHTDFVRSKPGPTIERRTLGPGWCAVSGCPGSGKTLAVLDHLETLAHTGRTKVLVLTAGNSYKAWSESRSRLGSQVQYLAVNHKGLSALPPIDVIERKNREADITVVSVDPIILECGGPQLTHDIPQLALETFRQSAEQPKTQDDAEYIVVIDEFHLFTRAGILNSYLTEILPKWDRSATQLILVAQSFEDVPTSIKAAAFGEFAWRLLNIVAKALHGFGQSNNLEELQAHMQRCPPQHYRYRSNNGHSCLS